MEAAAVLFSALAFLIEAFTIGAIIAAVLIIPGIAPVNVHHNVTVVVSSKGNAMKYLKSIGVEIDFDQEEEEYDDEYDDEP